MYVTKDEFLEYTGKDLELDFKNGNFDIDDTVPMFIRKVESASIEILKDRYDNYNIENTINNHLEKFKEGMIWQLDYILAHGELYNNADADPSKYLSPTAIMFWRNIGLCNNRSY